MQTNTQPMAFKHCLYADEPVDASPRRPRKQFFAVGTLKIYNIRVFEEDGRRVDLMKVEGHVGDETTGVHISASTYHFMEEDEVIELACRMLREQNKNATVFFSKETRVEVLFQEVGITERMKRISYGMVA